MDIKGIVLRCYYIGDLRLIECYGCDLIIVDNYVDNVDNVGNLRLGIR